MRTETPLNPRSFDVDADSDARPAWAAMALLPLPAALRRVGNAETLGDTLIDDDTDMAWLIHVSDEITDIMQRQAAALLLTDGAALTLAVRPWGYVLSDGDEEIASWDDPTAMWITGMVHGEVAAADPEAPQTWLVKCDDGLWAVFMDNTGMGMGGECCSTADGGFYALRDREHDRVRFYATNNVAQRVAS